MSGGLVRGGGRLAPVWAAVLGLLVVLVPSPVAAQTGGLGAAITPVFASPVVVGQQAASGLLQFVNFSSGAAASQPVTLTGIQVNTSCAVGSATTGGASPCPTPEPRPVPSSPVLDIGDLSTPGTTCPGGPFFVTGPDAEGDYVLTPSTGPVTLAPVGQPGSTCAIAFTFDTVQRPTDGATTVVAVMTASSATFPAGVRQTGSAVVTVIGEGRYTPLSPTRIEDTRTGAGGLSGPLGPGATVDVQVAGRGGIPTAVSAVVLNVTVTQPTADGFLTLYPSGSPRPLASNLNFTPAKTVPNLVVVKVGALGKVAMFNSAGTTHVIYDVAGYFVEGGSGTAGRLQPLPPARIADTRLNAGGVRLGPGHSFDLQVTGRGGAPTSGVTAAVLNVAATGTTAESYLTVYPTGEARPLAANLNFTANDTVSNRLMTKLGVAGKVTVYNNAGSTDVVVDIGGTYTDGSVAGTTGGYVPLAPERILDTRSGAPLPAGGTLDVQVAGQGGVPATGARAVVLNVTVTQPAGAGYLTIYPSGAARPLASDLNYAAGETRPNLVVVQLGDDGRAGLYTPVAGHVIFDVAGLFT